MNENKFEASNPLVSSLANKIENAVPGKVLYVEKMIRGKSGLIKTDFDIELDDLVIEVTQGGGKGKASQILNKIQPETSKNVVIFGPNLRPSVQKELANRGIKFFIKEENLISFINQ